MKLIISLIIGLTLISNLIRAQDPFTIIRKYIELTGGEEQWNEVKTCIARGYAWYGNGELSDSIESTKTYVIFREWPYKQRIDFYQDSILKESSIYLDGKGSINFQDFSIDLSTLIYYDFYPQQLLTKINSKDYFIEFKSVEQIDNKEFMIVQFSNKDLIEYYYFDKESNLLEFEKTSMALDIMTVIKDYRQVGEFLIPFKTSKNRNGNLFFEEKLSEMQFNVSMPDNIFMIK